MKKKILAIFVMAALAMSTVACTSSAGSNDSGIEKDENNDSKDDATQDSDKDEDSDDSNAGGDSASNGDATEVTGALQAFEAIWNSFGDDEKFPAMGGDFANAVDGMPGNCNLEEKDTIIYQFYVPEDMYESVDDMASLMHMMNANTYTGVVVHVADSQAFADAVKTNIQGTNWVCGFPDRLVVAELADGYVAYAFGAEDIMVSYAANIQKVFPSAKIVYDLSLTE